VTTALPSPYAAAEWRDRTGRAPASFAQRRLWLIDQRTGSTLEYNRPVAHRLRGPIQCEHLVRAVSVIAERHDVLRTHFSTVDGEPEQIVVDRETPVTVDDQRGYSPADRDEIVRTALQREWSEPFDLNRGPLIRIRILRTADDEHLLIRTYHHIVCDAWSETIFNRELAIIYEALRTRRHHGLEPLPVQYADFARWERRAVDESTFRDGATYWRQHLDGAAGVELPADRIGGDGPKHGAVHRLTLGPASLCDLKRVGRTHGTTLFMTLLSAFAVALHHFADQHDFIIGSPITNRPHSSFESLIGLFVNTLAIRIRIDAPTTFARLLEQVRSTTLAAYRHRDIPFDRVIEAVTSAGGLRNQSFIRVMFALQNAPQGPLTLPGIDIERLHSESPRTRFDLELYAWEWRDELRTWWLYNRDAYDPWRIEHLAGHFRRVVENMCAEPSMTI
jgi:hypothetical protein